MPSLHMLIASLWLLSGIVLYLISDRIYPDERSEPIGPFQIALMLLGPICWTYIGVTYIVLTVIRQKDSNFQMDYGTSWMVLTGSLLPWAILLIVLSKI